MDLESLPGLTARAAEILWVEHIEEVLITSGLIH
jgi:hypothetical protein